MLLLYVDWFELILVFVIMFCVCSYLFLFCFIFIFLLRFLLCLFFSFFLSIYRVPPLADLLYPCQNKTCVQRSRLKRYVTFKAIDYDLALIEFITRRWRNSANWNRRKWKKWKNVLQRRDITKGSLGGPWPIVAQVRETMCEYRFHL